MELAQFDVQEQPSDHADRVRGLTAPAINQRIDEETRHAIEAAASESSEELDGRITAVDAEWDVERVLEAEAAGAGLLGLALALAHDRRWLVLPGIVAAMLLLHATAGPYPLLPLFRRLGTRTRDEIDRERYALKALRGDFDALRRSEGLERAQAAWRAVCL